MPKLIEATIPALQQRKALKLDGTLYLMRIGDPAATVTSYFTDPSDPTNTVVTPDTPVIDESNFAEKVNIDLKDRFFDNNGGEYCAVYYEYCPDDDVATVVINDKTLNLVGKRPAKFYKG